MNIEHLRAFVELACTLNYTKTAAALYISQPALTKQIKVLEKFLGVELFERTSRSAHLSDIGAEFLVYARNVIAEYDAGLKHIANYHRALVRQINLGTHMFFSHMGFSSLIASYQCIFPNSYINALETLSSSDDLIAQVGSGKLDAAIFTCTASQLDQLPIKVFPLKVEEIVVIINRTHPLAAEKSVALTQLADEPFVFPSSTYTWCHIMSDIFASEGVTPNIVCESALDRTIANLVTAGTGLSMFSLSVARSLQKTYPALSILRLSHRYEKLTVIGVRKDYRSNATLRRFVDFARSWASGYEEFPAPLERIDAQDLIHEGDAET